MVKDDLKKQSMIEHYSWETTLAPRFRRSSSQQRWSFIYMEEGSFLGQEFNNTQMHTHTETRTERRA